MGGQGVAVNTQIAWFSFGEYPLENHPGFWSSERKKKKPVELQPIMYFILSASRYKEHFIWKLLIFKIENS